MGFPILVRCHLYIESGPWPLFHSAMNILKIKSYKIIALTKITRNPTFPSFRPTYQININGFRRVIIHFCSNKDLYILEKVPSVRLERISLNIIEPYSMMFLKMAVNFERLKAIDFH